MNLRKFISGVSALAIAASAFAGMAVTASADYATDTSGITTWDFSDYTSDNTKYTSVFTELTGKATISTEGIKFNTNTLSTSAFADIDKVAFVAPSDGMITISYWGNANYVYGYILDSSLNSLKQGGGTGYEGTTTSYELTAGTKYYLTIRSNANNKNRTGGIRRVEFDSYSYEVPTYTEPIYLDLNNRYLFTTHVDTSSNAEATMGQSKTALSFGRKNTGIADGYVKFHAPQTGKIEAVFGSGETQTRYYKAYIYSDVEGNGVLDSATVVKMDETRTLTAKVNAGSDYYLVGCINTAGQWCGTNISSVLFKPYVDVTDTTTDTNGSLSLSKSTDLLAGEEVTVTVNANDGYVLDRLFVGGVDVTSSVSNDTYTFNISADTEVSATFKAAELVEISGAKTWYPSDFKSGSFTRTNRYSADCTMRLSAGGSGTNVANGYIMFNNSSQGPEFTTTVPGFVTVKAYLYNKASDANVTIQGTVHENAIDHSANNTAAKTATITQYVAAGDVTIKSNSAWCVTQVTFTPAGTATLNSISNIHEFTKGTDDPVTAAVLNITVSGLSTKIDVSFDGGDAKTTGVYVVGPVKIGVIVPGKDLGITADNDNDLFAVSAHID